MIWVNGNFRYVLLWVSCNLEQGNILSKQSLKKESNFFQWDSWNDSTSARKRSRFLWCFRQVLLKTNMMWILVAKVPVTSCMNVPSLLGIVICPSVATCWGCLHPLLWRPWSNRYHCVCLVMFLPGCVPGWSCLDVQPLTFLSPGVSWAKQTKPRFWVVLGLLDN